MLLLIINCILNATFHYHLISIKIENNIFSYKHSIHMHSVRNLITMNQTIWILVKLYPILFYFCIHILKINDLG